MTELSIKIRVTLPDDKQREFFEELKKLAEVVEIEFDGLYEEIYVEADRLN